MDPVVVFEAAVAAAAAVVARVASSPVPVPPLSEGKVEVRDLKGLEDLPLGEEIPAELVKAEPARIGIGTDFSFRVMGWVRLGLDPEADTPERVDEFVREVDVVVVVAIVVVPPGVVIVVGDVEEPDLARGDFPLLGELDPLLDTAEVFVAPNDNFSDDFSFLGEVIVPDDPAPTLDFDTADLSVLGEGGFAFADLPILGDGGLAEDFSPLGDGGFIDDEDFSPLGEGCLGEGDFDLSPLGDGALPVPELETGGLSYLGEGGSIVISVVAVEVMTDRSLLGDGDLADLSLLGDDTVGGIASANPFKGVIVAPVTGEIVVASGLTVVAGSTEVVVASGLTAFVVAAGSAEAVVGVDVASVSS